MFGESGSDAKLLSEAARNLLFDCAGLSAGDEVVICHEAAEHGWYDFEAAESVATEAEALGLRVRRCEALPPDREQPAEVAELLTSPGNIIFFARIGDQGRFDGLAKGRRVMVYARNANDLASEFGRVPHQAMLGLKKAVDEVLFTARTIEITCPNGTRVTGRAPVASDTGETPADVTTRRFPLGVPAPVPANGFSGRVALTGALTPTGNRCYEPAVLPLEHPVFGLVENGRIAGFEGDAAEIVRIRAHYQAVADAFGIEPFVVHSWHAGIHPGCRYFDATGQDLDYWSNTVFSSPRLLHFHTCGTSAPGEISWNLPDATVLVDGVALWDKGRLMPQAFPALSESLSKAPSLARLF
ncbi:hypothetical protein [Pseudoruegeria sp. HB172150]|uniref:hypothetical protein n=1 Tax=Pseudoruegeria sp. HB172150 TaxID=2721164 RepID=UPI001552AD93|nr:hypothetical protein [Pseudoruegeria sp. HB172150]